MLTVSEDWWTLQKHVLHIFLGFVFYSCNMGFGPPNAGEIKEHFVGLFGVSFLGSLFCVFPLVKRLCADLVSLCSIKYMKLHIMYKIGLSSIVICGCSFKRFHKM